MRLEMKNGFQRYVIDLDLAMEGSSESTSSVPFEVLMINCHIEFINLFILNCLTSNFCFPKNISCTSRRERLFMNGRP